MSVSFNSLKKLEVSEASTAEFTLSVLEGAPVLILAFAGEANAPYFNALLRQVRPATAGKKRNTGITAEKMRENREKDRELFGRFILKGWEGVTDDSGQEVPWTPENGQAFLEALPSWIFDDIRAFASSPENFMADSRVDVEGAVKN